MKDARNLDKYSQYFEILQFERTQEKYRRKRVIEEILKVKPTSLLEVGCGNNPLFVDLHDIKCTVVEPAKKFARNALELARSYASNINVINTYIEEFDDNGEKYDMVILSCLLHEVIEPRLLLDKLKSLCHADSILHVNVPNSHSLHRLLAVSMGLIKDETIQSETQFMMQQRDIVYDFDLLEEELRNAGFRIIDHGSIFVKPFTHEQMQNLVDLGFLNDAILDGLDKLVNALPEIGSEIWVNAKIIK